MKSLIALPNNLCAEASEKMQRYADGENGTEIRGQIASREYNKQGDLILEKLGYHTLTRAVVLGIYYSYITIRIFKELHELKLTPCELEVLQLYADGYDSQQIAKIRSKNKNKPLSVNTINAQRDSIKTKLGCKTIIRAVVIGIHYKLIEIRFVGE